MENRVGSWASKTSCDRPDDLSGSGTSVASSSRVMGSCRFQGITSLNSQRDTYHMDPYGGFLGYPRLNPNHPNFSGIFPYKPSSYWGYPISGNPPIGLTVQHDDVWNTIMLVRDWMYGDKLLHNEHGDGEKWRNISFKCQLEDGHR